MESHESTTATSVDVRNLTFSYDGSRTLFNGLGFRIAPKSVFAVVGPSGCGKSTLLKILSGLIWKTCFQNGNTEIFINANLALEEYLRLGKISFVFQQPTLLPYLTVRQNIELPAKLQGQPPAIPIDSLISTVGLSQYADSLPSRLSGGMKTRVALARSFSTAPSLLLLDEPFSNLDLGWRFKLYLELLQFQAQLDTTVLLVTHNIEEAVLLADEVLVMDQNGSAIHQLHVSHSETVPHTAKDLVEQVGHFQSDILSLERLFLEPLSTNAQLPLLQP